MTNQEFIIQLKAGKANAFRELVAQFQDKVFRSCLSFVPNKEDAEDIAQEVFAEVFKSIHKFKEESQLSTWIYKITTNKCLAFIRKKNAKKRAGFMQSLFGPQGQEQQSYFVEFNHPGVLLEHKEQTTQIFKAIDALSDNQRIVFTYAKIEGKSYQEIAEITGKSLSSIESILYRAKQNLQQQLIHLKKMNR